MMHRKAPRWLIVALSASCVARTAAAQTEGPDVVPRLPNVLLLVDTSGSMEWKSSANVDPVCDPTNPNTSTLFPNEKSRWIDLVETLTGSIQDYSCYAEKRDLTTNFKDEFKLSTTDLPYDLGYEYAYHRPLSNLCAPGPGTLPNPLTPYTFPTPSVTFRPYQGGQITLNPGTPCAFNQNSDGLLDSFEGLFRFGLMTFDTDFNPGTGVNGGTADYKSGIAGTWSYYLSNPSRCRIPGTSVNCTSGATPGTAGCCMGAAWDCPTPTAKEVGARNAAAPPWEGRMVAFGPSAEDGRMRNQWIQQVLLATRPYGPTPIAGMLTDARDFFWYDDSLDPLNAGQYFGPSRDPLVQASCRPNYIILLTDGEPSGDMRPDCENAGVSVNCPYARAEELTNEMVTSVSNPPIRTFVVGFAISQVTLAGSDGGAGSNIDCATMDLGLCSPTPTDPALRACCTLNNIAYNGTPVNLRGLPAASPTDPLEDHALFPKTSAELRTAISRILQRLDRKVTGRTYPVTGSASDSADGVGIEITSGAKVLPTGLWKGVLGRKRIICDNTTLQPVIQDIDAAKGDDFIANVNENPDNRKLFSVHPDLTLASTREATWSMRPYLETGVNDGVGHYSGTQTAFVSPSTFSSQLTPEALKVTAATCATSTATACERRIVDWAAGVQSASPVSRCKQPGDADCSVIGDIFHSVPVIRSGQAREFLRDQSYAGFSAFVNVTLQRDSMLYTSSNDGFFHGFRLGGGSLGPVSSKTPPNENFAFVPPAVLPLFSVMYPGQAGAVLNRVPALDGVPIIKDVAVTQNGPRALSTNYPFRFERKTAPDISANEIHTWRTIMVQGFGGTRGGYYALDVTDPKVPQGTTNAGPKFLWQLTTDAAGNQLFGRGSGTPLITTLLIKHSLANQPDREVAVAVLPGGMGDAPVSDLLCPTSNADKNTAIQTSDSGVTSNAFRDHIRCYAANGLSKNSVAARSLTFVRLDTGEIIRTFRPAGLLQPVTFATGLNGVVTDYTYTASGSSVPLNIGAPIVGTPVAYPAQTGAVADRVFVGDAEGRIWRVDVSNTDPGKWAMNVFFDPYIQPGAPLIGQPVQTPPIVSVDDQGQLTVAYSTGDQDNLAPDAAQVNYVVSITEAASMVGATRVYRGKYNWRQTFTGGKRVLGPMTLFDRSLYFSTFEQSVTTNCTDFGGSQVWGLDYLLATGATPDTGGKPKLGPIDYKNSVVSGVGLRQLPSCSSGGSTGSSSDAFLGYGQVTTSTSTNPGKFQLVIQKGGQNATIQGGIATDTVDLAPPQTPVRISSWAPIIE